MLKLNFFMKSGVERTQYMGLMDGADPEKEADRLVSNWSKIENLSAKDEQSGQFFFVRGDDVAYLTIDIIDPNVKVFSDPRAA